jgi:hypothetical protein
LAFRFALGQQLKRIKKAVEMWRDRDSAWRDVSEGIKKVVGDLLGK